MTGNLAPFVLTHESRVLATYDWHGFCLDVWDGGVSVLWHRTNTTVLLFGPADELAHKAVELEQESVA